MGETVLDRTRRSAGGPAVDDLRRVAGYVEQKHLDREAIQLEIQQVSLKREAHIKKVRARELAASDFGEAMKQAIREQAIAKGFECDGC